MTHKAPEMKHIGHEIEALEDERAKLKKMLGPVGKIWPITPTIHDNDDKNGRNDFEAARIMIANSERDTRNGDERRAWMHLVTAQGYVIRGQHKQLKDAQTRRLMDRPDVGGRPSTVERAAILYLLAKEESGDTIVARARAAIAKDTNLQNWYGGKRERTLRDSMQRGEEEVERRKT